MSGEVAASPEAHPGGRAAQQYGTIVVVGGGCYGSYYVRQLRRAVAAGALGYRRMLVVDRDPACRVAAELAAGALGGPPRDIHDASAAPTGSHPSRAPEVVAAQWTDFFERYLAEADGDPSAAADAIVPSPLMPHLMADWLLARARGRWPDRQVRSGELVSEPNVPWQRSSPDGTHYVSFAEWMCPVNCVEPAMCPEIRGPRTWSLPPALRAYVAAERARGRALAGPVIFHCRHRAYGVGMFDTADVLAADRLVAEVGSRGAAEVLIGTTSHCHGAVRVLSVGAPSPTSTTS